MTVHSLRRGAILLLCVAASGVGVLHGRNSAADADEIAKQEVIKIDDAFNKAVVEKDGAALEQLLADKLSWVARGDRLTKPKVISDITTANLHFKSLTHDDLLLNVFGNTVVVTGHSSSVLEYKGKTYLTPRLFTTVYMKLDGRWQMVAHQVSNIEEK